MKGDESMTEDTYYKIFTIRFRKEEDAELIKELESHDTSKRQWLHDLYYLKPEIPKDLCSIRDVEELMRIFRVHPQTIRNVVEALKKKTT